MISIVLHIVLFRRPYEIVTMPTQLESITLGFARFYVQNEDDITWAEPLIVACQQLREIRLILPLIDDSQYGSYLIVSILKAILLQRV